MAIYHLSVKPVSRATGRSSVAAAAYRAAECLMNDRDGLTHDFRGRSGVEHAEIVLPGDGLAEDGSVVRAEGRAWARSRSALWNAAEATEKRKDARVASEIEIAQPEELTPAQRLTLTRAFAQDLAGRYGVAVDFAIHSPHGHTDIRNHHAHLLLTTRVIGEQGLGEKAQFEWENRKLKAAGLPTGPEQIRDIRMAWEGFANTHLVQAGLDVRIDHRSHQARGLELEPTQHVGVHATQMERRGIAVSRSRMDAATAQRNVDLIREKPEQVLVLITGEKSVFDRRDIARVLHRYVEEPEAFQNALARVMASPALVELRAERRDDEQGRVVEAARYSTREMVAVEGAMASGADRLAAAGGFGVSERHVEAAMARQDAAIQRAGGAGLSEEQRVAIGHVTEGARIATVVGLAGTGKSTLLTAAREAWEAQGYRVRGAALAGKAAESLEEAAGIGSRTLASWEQSWSRGFDLLGRGDVFVIDEAGMVGSVQLSHFIQAAERAGAKIVLVGDPEQLQPIGPGAAFRAIAERVGFVNLLEVRRQREPWQGAASIAFGRHRTAEGLAAYADHGAIAFAETVEQSRNTIVRDVLADMAARPEGSRLVMAHRNADVQALNDAIRAGVKEQGGLTGELVYRTAEGARSFAVGDRVLFRENNRDLGVKNGMLGTVERVVGGSEWEMPGPAAPELAAAQEAGPPPTAARFVGERLVVRLDSADGRGRAPAGGASAGRVVDVSMADYAAVDHGYATTIHKSQGATVDRAFVLASETMDRHLTYVAMTRHRASVQLYAGQDEFAGRQGGVLVEHGPAPYEHDPENRQSYFVTLERGGGARHTIWGVDLERAMAVSGAKVGDRIGLEVVGSEPVQLPDGTLAERHAWEVLSVETLAQRRLVSRLSRSQAKETTLDYPQGVQPQSHVPDIQPEGVRPEGWVTKPARTFGEREAESDQGFDAAGPGLDRFAARRGIDLGRDIVVREHRIEPMPERQSAARPVMAPLGEVAPAETVHQAAAPGSRKSKFAGLKLNAAPLSRGPLSQEPLRLEPAESALSQAVGQFAEAVEAARLVYRPGQSLPAPQQAAVDAGIAAILDAGNGLVQSDVVDTLNARATLITPAAQGREGRAVVIAAIEGARDERQARERDVINRQLILEGAAYEVVARWGDLERRYDQAGAVYEWDAQREIGSALVTVARDLKAHPPLEALLRERGAAFGIAPGSRLDLVVRTDNLDRALAWDIKIDHGPRPSRGMSPGM